MRGKDFVSVLDAKGELDAIVQSATDLKQRFLAGDRDETLAGKTLALVFEKSSTRTRVSFEVAMSQLGGRSIFLNPQDMQMGRGETIPDTARTLSRYVDCIAYRAFRHDRVLELAENSSVPVINALDDLEHPCQALADMMTIVERRENPEVLRLTYVGDGNNVCNSLILACSLMRIDITVACPGGYEPDDRIVREAKALASQGGSKCQIVQDPRAAVRNADVIYTDVWVSMGDEEEARQRLKAFADYQVNSDLLSLASPDCIVMHCLPAHRGQEITDDVIDGPRSIVFDQAENRLHAQKALLIDLLR
ncbi:MAG: ornithine carbamoyltransferase [Thermoplasmata archaeon]